MPRYAEGSIEKALYLDLMKEVSVPTEAKTERRNSKRSRAHRLDSLLDEAVYVRETVRIDREQEKIEGIASMLRYVEHGLLTRSNFLRAVRDIVRE